MIDPNFYTVQHIESEVSELDIDEGLKDALLVTLDRYSALKSKLAEIEAQEPFTYCYTDVNGEAKEICESPEEQQEQDKRIITPLFKKAMPVQPSPAYDYIRDDINENEARTDGYTFAFNSIQNGSESVTVINSGSVDLQPSPAVAVPIEIEVGSDAYAHIVSPWHTGLPKGRHILNAGLSTPTPPSNSKGWKFVDEGSDTVGFWHEESGAKLLIMDRNPGGIWSTDKSEERERFQLFYDTRFKHLFSGFCEPKNTPLSAEQTHIGNTEFINIDSGLYDNTMKCPKCNFTYEDRVDNSHTENKVNSTHVCKGDDLPK